jgi:hypothetical protein
VPDRSDLPQGTLDLLILHVVAAGAMHGSKGRRQLKEEAASWLRLTEAIGLILKTAGGSR